MPWQELPRVVTAIFDRLAEKRFLKNLSREEFVSEIVDFYE